MALKYYLSILAVLTMVFVTDTALGQVNTPSPRFRPQPVDQSDGARPFADAGVFDYDTQLFAPLEFTNGENPDPHTGFFFTYDRTYMNINSSQVNNAAGDYMWGNRYELGWMTDVDDGWDFIFQSGNGISFFNGNDVLVAQPMLVDTTFSTFEVNKIFRQPISTGGYFEPYIGARFMSASDESIEDTSQNTAGGVGQNRFKQNVDNNAFGLQAGGRHVKRNGRFQVASDISVATMYNQQDFLAQDILTVGGTTGISSTTLSSQAFLPVLDFSYQVSYNISRDIAVRGGAQVVYMWDGIVRADTRPTNFNPNSVFSGGAQPTSLSDDSTLAAGFIFGVEWRR